jgi:HPt (histidine-containing phosphotransfer) domain-containing protein
MTQSLNAFKAGDCNAAAEMEQQFHSLAGIAGTFGYPDITETAREGERRCGTGSIDGITTLLSDLRARAAVVSESKTTVIASTQTKMAPYWI